MKILVRNLPRTSTELELREWFSAHGEVKACQLVLDAETGLSKGFGFVEMPDDVEAKTAIIELDRTKVAKNRIRVKLAEDKSAPAAKNVWGNDAETPSE